MNYAPRNFDIILITCGYLITCGMSMSLNNCYSCLRNVSTVYAFFVLK